MSHELGVIGAGNMAEAIVRGLIASKRLAPAQIVASDVSQQRREVFAGMGVKAVDDNRAAAKGAATVLLSVKPQMMKGVLNEVGSVLSEQTLVVSIAAGISSSLIERELGAGKPWRVVRTMPNTPMLLGAGVVAVARGRHATAADVEKVKQLFEASAAVLVLDEEKMDAVTAVSGSGPAYFFLLVEQMARAGVSLGLSESEALLLATRTAYGAGKMLVQEGADPVELRKKVTSPHGTTQAAIEVMEARGVAEGIYEAVRRAAQRSEELGKQAGN